MMPLSRAVLCTSLMMCLFPAASGFLSTGPSFVLARERVGPAACRSSRTCTQKLMATIAGRSEVDADRSIVRKVAMEKEGELQTVVEAMKRLEKASRAQKDETQNSMMLQKLTGKWRLICSTGDKSGKTVTGTERG